MNQKQHLIFGIFKTNLKIEYIIINQQLLVPDNLQLNILDNLEALSVGFEVPYELSYALILHQNWCFGDVPETARLRHGTDVRNV